MLETSPAPALTPESEDVILHHYWKILGLAMGIWSGNTTRNIFLDRRMCTNIGGASVTFIQSGRLARSRRL